MCINYIFININNSVINNNVWKTPDLILLFEVPMGKQKGSFEICRQLGHAPSRSLARPVLYTLDIIISVDIIVINKF
jgi:hypothetical protein